MHMHIDVLQHKVASVELAKIGYLNHAMVPEPVFGVARQCDICQRK
jgi:hypothetical protein